MLDQIFKAAGPKSLQLDTDTLLSRTDHQFVGEVVKRVGTFPIKELRANGDRRAGYLYFKVGSRHYSFAHDKKRGELLFSEIVRGKWEFIVGWRVM